MKVSIALFLFVSPLAQQFAATQTTQPCDEEINAWQDCLSNEFCGQCLVLIPSIDQISAGLGDACTQQEDYYCPYFECCSFCQFESSALILCSIDLFMSTRNCQLSCNGVDVQETFNGGPTNGGTTNDDSTNDDSTNGGSTNDDSTNGGSTSGGSTNGGTTSGGSTSGGSTNGGTNNGRTNNGGSNNGGTNNGGSNNGGTNNGGSNKSGALKNSEFVFVSALASVVASVTAAAYLM